MCNKQIKERGGKVIYLVVIIACFAIYKWFSWWLAAASLAAWIAKKGYMFPNEQDNRELSAWVLEKAFKID